MDIREFTSRRTLWAALLVLLTVAPAAAQSTQPVWWPPLSLYGHPVSSPLFDFPTWSRFSYCRPAPLAWGFDPYPNYGPCDGAPWYSTINCPGNFVAHRPNGFYFTSDFAPTTVDFRHTTAIATLGPAGTTVLSTADLQPNFDAGTRVTMGMRLFGCYRLEGTYWGSFQWKDYAAAQDNTGVGGAGTLATLLSGGFGNAAVPALDNNTFVSESMRTKMNSGELNLLYWLDMPPGPFDVSLLAGLRYLDVRDQFNLQSINGVQDNNLTVNTVNRMWFGQIGLSTDWLISSRFWLNGTLKGGLANNQASLFNNYITTAGGVATVNPSAATQNRTGSLLDLSLVGNLQVLPWLVARIGYQALFVQGIANAAENIQTNNTLQTNGPAQVNAREAAVFHGLLIGLGGNW
jgi:hypothetical protein